MSKSSYVDFKAVKSALKIEEVLEHYGLLDQFKRNGESLSGPCPIHKGNNATQFRVSLSKNVWNCFGQCKKGGNVLDFISRMEKVNIYSAAQKAIEWFDLDPSSLSTKPDEEETKDPDQPQEEDGAKEARADIEAKQASEGIVPNKPLKFRLEKLERDHPYLVERGLTPETISEFGLGYCLKGMMAGRIAIPIHNPKGEVVAYAGRFPGEAPDGTPKYKLPQGFRKSLELFNIDRAINEPADAPLVIVEGFFGAMRLYQHGLRKVIALMGSSMSEAQEKLIRLHTNGQSRVIVILDEDEAGRSGREDISVRLSKFVFVKVHCFDEEGRQPEQLSAEEVASLIS